MTNDFVYAFLTFAKAGQVASEKDIVILANLHKLQEEVNADDDDQKKC